MKKRKMKLYAIIDTGDDFLRETTWHYDVAKTLNKANIESGRLDSRVVKFIEADRKG